MNLKSLFFVFAVSSLFFVSCNKELKIDVPEGISEPAVRNFIYRYGESTDVKWKKRGDFNVAIFHTAPITKVDGNSLTTVWYTDQGVDVQFTQEIPFNSLPDAVKSGFNATIVDLNYTSWQVDDDADIVIRLGLDYIYIIEIDNGTTSRELSFSKTGIFLKDVVDTDTDPNINFIEPKFLTDELRQALLGLFPNSQYVSLLEIDIKDNLIIADILESNIHKEITFDNKFVWISTEYETTLYDVKAFMNEVNNLILTNIIEFGKKNNIDFTDEKVQKSTKVEVLNHYTSGVSFELEYNFNGSKFEISVDKDGVVRES